MTASLAYRAKRRAEIAAGVSDGRIPLTQSREALVDPADAPLIVPFTWYAHKEGGGYYAYAWDGGAGRILKLHRHLLGAKPGQIVDHINGDGLDNRRANLRIVSSQENGFNKRGYSSGTPYKGIYLYKANGRWTGQIGRRDGSRASIGYHDTQEAAALARDRLALELHGPFARLNFPHATMAHTTPAPAGHQAQGPAPVQVVSEDTTAISPRLAPALNGAGVLSEGA